MTIQEATDCYYDAWQNKAGDFSDVPLAEDFEFTGPVESFDSGIRKTVAWYLAHEPWWRAVLDRSYLG